MPLIKTTSWNVVDVNSRDRRLETVPLQERCCVVCGARPDTSRVGVWSWACLRRLLCIAVVMGLAWGVVGNAWGDRVTSLIRTLQSAEDYKQRLVAAIGLARLKDARAVPALIAAIHDANPAVQGVAADVLGELADHRARAPLEALIRRSKNSFVRGRAEKALLQLPKAPPPPRPPPKKVEPDGMTVRGLMGTLDQEAIQVAIRGRFEAIMGCVNRRMADLPGLGGTIRLKVRVAATGKTKWLRISSSNLGSLQVEQCIVEVLETAVFEAPDGGEAEFSIPLEFTGSVVPERISATNPTIATALRAACKGLLVNGSPSAPPLRPPSGLVVTLYLDAAGSVVSTGLAAGGKEIPVGFAQRFVDNASKLELGYRPRSGMYAKLSYRLDCPGG